MKEQMRKLGYSEKQIEEAIENGFTGIWEAAEKAASQFSQIGNGIYARTKAKKTYLPKVCRVRLV